MDPKKIYILAFEWSESPYHQGTYRVFLSYHPNSGRWALSARQNPSGVRLSWKTGHREEDPKEVAIELLRKSYDRGALTFDVIPDEGPFAISIKDFVPKKTRMDETTKPHKTTLALAEALRRGREVPVSQRKPSIDGICKALGIERSDLKPNAPKPSVRLFFGAEH